MLSERSEAAGRRLIALPGDTLHAVVTNLTKESWEACRHDNSRADGENRIRELELDFAVDGFCMKSFRLTEAVLLLDCLLFSLPTTRENEIPGTPGTPGTPAPTPALYVTPYSSSAARHA